MNNNPKGRPKGSKNKRTTQWERLSQSIVECNAAKFNAILDETEGVEFARLYLKALEYFKPKMARINHQIDDQDNEITFIFKDYDSPSPS